MDNINIIIQALLGMDDIDLIICIMALLILVSFLLASISVVGLACGAYRRIRRLGYTPFMTSTMITVGLIVGSYLTYVTVDVLLQWDGLIGIMVDAFVTLCLSLVLFWVAFVSVVHGLPKRDIRVAGLRQVRFPFTAVGWGLVALAISVWIRLITHLFRMPELLSIDLLWKSDLFWDSIRGGVYLIVLASICFKIAGLLRTQTSIEATTMADPRPPVLYLRAFASEDAHFAQGASSRYSNTVQKAWLRLPGPGDVVPSSDDPVISVSFEQYLGNTFREHLGPFVALGNPEDYLPREGATRTYSFDENWYDYFMQLSERAACVVITVSISKNLEQELTFIRRKGLQQRLFLLTPPFQTEKKALGPLTKIVMSAYSAMLYAMDSSSQDSTMSWTQLSENLKKLGLELGDDPGCGAVITFDSEGKAKVIVTRALEPIEFVKPISEYLDRSRLSPCSDAQSPSLLSERQDPEMAPAD